ncbi:hypothetical protein [Halomonas eurihalina]|uniref:hypothetical protein n=1 Tax=Halomonas eurihalina TaxID=42566 RepID=UPI001659169C|nr:hypothetical protein [Halomonas eurihalina]MDR5858183.1 hypothetical protein [Halomonas eurihalina]
MRMTKPQQRLVAALRERQQLVYHLHGGAGGCSTARPSITAPSNRWPTTGC